jgi:hypothetical protein
MKINDELEAALSEKGNLQSKVAMLSTELERNTKKMKARDDEIES